MIQNFFLTTVNKLKKLNSACKIPDKTWLLDHQSINSFPFPIVEILENTLSHNLFTQKQICK